MKFKTYVVIPNDAHNTVVREATVEDRRDNREDFIEFVNAEMDHGNAIMAGAAPAEDPAPSEPADTDPPPAGDAEPQD